MKIAWELKKNEKWEEVIKLTFGKQILNFLYF